ncbi:hypothetical protein DFA_11766 [Cavenderia fasciculata]|uniref:Uncharacterized protein n=1 Tax=Cavenderia fasciculata TaxID=261658 RepID=F4QE58_CACFS|nr:uncharacterized protein DFA_11766 [Cavenderia fasciculata]EGG14005.1 hypothetical protein DFA_11766 [Cavenderia fasciculata]|eukprot:XP_004350713.1 hypothetical protein DFA_11766 [Cavenderia fasciculata]
MYTIKRCITNRLLNNQITTSITSSSRRSITCLNLLSNRYHYSSSSSTTTTTKDDPDIISIKKNDHHIQTNPRGHWVDKLNQKEYLDKMGKDMGFFDDENIPMDQYYEKWYQVSKIDFIEHKGRGLLLHYNDSVHQLVKAVYSEYKWLPWKFNNSPKNFWRDHQNQLDYLLWLGERIGITNPRDWYRITKNDFIENHGNSLLLLYGGSPVRVIMQVFNKNNNEKKEDGQDTFISPQSSIFIDYKYLIWRFTNLPRGSFKDMTILKEFIEFTKDYYRMEKKEDWYRLSWTQIRDIGGFSLVKKNGGICKSLQLVYPDIEWEVGQFTTPGKKSSQRLLRIFLERLFPEDSVHEDYRNLSQLRYQESTGAGFQLDFFIPRLQLAFEYQGKQHFQDTSLFGDYKIYHDRDVEKRLECKKHGIHIIDVPYWWDNHLDSLVGTIQQYDASILPLQFSKQMYQPIPKTYQKIQTNKKIHTLFID